MSLAAPQQAMKPSQDPVDPNRSLQCAVLDGGQLAVVRVQGRGTFGNSMPLKRFAQHVQSGPVERFVVDLQFCEAMDSTFMGVIAGVAIGMVQKKKSRLVIFGANDNCKRQLKNLGLVSLIDFRDEKLADVERCEGSLKTTAEDESSRLEQIYLTLSAHKELCRVDSQNEMRFQAVIEYLEKSLKEEGGGQA